MVSAETLTNTARNARLRAAALDAAATATQRAETLAAEAARLKQEAASAATAAQNAPDDANLQAAAATAATQAQTKQAEADEAHLQAEVCQSAWEQLTYSPVKEAFTSLSTYLLLFVGGIVVWIFYMVTQGELLETLQTTETARGLVTFFITATVVGLAFMLAYQAFADSTTGEKFRQAREVFMSLVGILGTIVGFYFGAAKNESEKPPEAPTPPPAAVDTTDKVAPPPSAPPKAPPADGADKAGSK